jgi:selenocysteine lyase/cysteine desulfurase
VAPYVQINMNNVSDERVFTHKITEADLKLCYKDALFISPHKFVGGPGSSGILVAKKNLLFSRKPDRVGGGPVFFVNELDHEWFYNTEEMEEAGTPGIIQDIRAALAFQLKD